MNADPFRRVPSKDEYKADLARLTDALTDDDIARIIKQVQASPKRTSALDWLILTAAVASAALAVAVWFLV